MGVGEAPALILVMAMLLAPLLTPKTVKSVVCPATGVELVKSLPGGWRQGISNLHSYMECEGFNAGADDSSTKMPKVILRSESYLAGLEAPVMYFKVDLVRTEDGQKAGFGVTQRLDFLEVEKVAKEGLLVDWNKKHRARMVKVKDRIINVNGVESNASSMAAELREGGDISLRVVRLGQEDIDRQAQRALMKETKKIQKMKGPPGLGMGIPEPKDSKVVVLHGYNVDKFIAATPLCVVMLYANWCGHCREIASEYTEAARLLHSWNLPKYTRIGKLDDGDEAHRSFGHGSEARFNYTSFPTLIVFEDGKEKFRIGIDSAEEFAGGIKAIAMGEDPEKEVEKVLLKQRPMLYRPEVGSEVVYDLEPETFDDVVLAEYPENNAVWIIEFYSDKCPFCRSLKPEYIKAAKELKEKFGEKIRVGAVNSRAFKDIPLRFGVTSYPWIISIYANKKVEDMTGLGGSESIVRFGGEAKQTVWRSKPKWSTVPILVPDDTAKTPGVNDAKDQTFNNTGSWRELLGRRTWFFLHTLAAKYPENPTEEDKAGVRHIVSGLGQHYPCPICRQHLRQKLVDPEVGPVPVDNRQDLAVWFCKLHNRVNADLKKAQQSCSPFQLDLMYLKSCGECSANPGNDTKPEEVAAWDINDYFKGLLPPPA